VFVLFQVRKCIAEGGFAVGELRHYCCVGVQLQDEMYNVRLRHVRATIVAVEKQLVLRIMSVALRIQRAMRMRRIMSSVACPALQHFSTLSNERRDFQKMFIGHKMRALSFPTTFI
jgi:hypothetical protein